MNFSEKSAEWNGQEWDGKDHSYLLERLGAARDAAELLRELGIPSGVSIQTIEEILKSEEQLAIEVLGEGYFA